MDPLTIGTIVSLGKSLISRVWPDPKQQAEATLKLAELEQKGDLAELNFYVQSMVGQLEINRVEANHKSIFVAGWRPFIGWVCGVALLYKFLLAPMLGLVLDEVPTVEMTELWPLLMGMLGLGAMRSYDKVRRTDTEGMK